MTRPINREVLARYDAGTPLTSFNQADRADLRHAILSAPGYHDAKHAHHAMLVEDAKALYAMDTPEPQ